MLTAHDMITYAIKKRKAEADKPLKLSRSISYTAKALDKNEKKKASEFKTKYFEFMFFSKKYLVYLNSNDRIQMSEFKK